MAGDFSARAHGALADPVLRANFRRAMDGLMAKRRAQFPDRAAFEALRARGAAVRARALARLPDLLEQLEQRLVANGIHVHWAETIAAANAIVLGILQQAGARTVIKGKSMVTEEMELNAHLKAHGIERDRIRPGRVHHPAGRRGAVAHRHAVHPQEQGRDRPAVRRPHPRPALHRGRRRPDRRRAARMCASASPRPTPASRGLISRWPKPAPWC